jgi:CheY-like chemotaxis protein/DNA-binding HxlR family transcriptional regulator
MNMNILVVDDDEVLRNELSEWLQGEGFQVKSAGSGESAIKMVKDEDFNLILTDMKMPGLSGLDVLKAAKKYRPNAHMVMITAYGTIDSAVEAMKVGADDYITKPFEIEQLRNVIQNIANEIEFEKQVEKFEELDEPKSQDPFKLFKSLTQNVEGLCITKNNPNVNGLCITKMNPESLGERYDLQNTMIYQLTTERENAHSIHPKNIYELKLLINSFFAEHPEGAVLFDGLEDLLNQHSWEIVKQFILDISKDFLLKPSRIVITIQSHEIEEAVFSELKHLISTPYTQLMTESLSSPIRRNTVRSLSQYDSMSFSEIQKELEIKDAPKLSFHLKRLINDKILKKDEEKVYSLTDRGKRAYDFLGRMENIAMDDVQKNILLISNSKA